MLVMLKSLLNKSLDLNRIIYSNVLWNIIAINHRCLLFSQGSPMNASFFNVPAGSPLALTLSPFLSLVKTITHLASLRSAYILLFTTLLHHSSSLCKVYTGFQKQSQNTWCWAAVVLTSVPLCYTVTRIAWCLIQGDSDFQTELHMSTVV